MSISVSPHWILFVYLRASSTVSQGLYQTSVRSLLIRSDCSVSRIARAVRSHVQACNDIVGYHRCRVSPAICGVLMVCRYACRYIV